MGSSKKYSLYSLAVVLQGSGLDNVVFESQNEQEIYLFSKMSGLASGSTQHAIQSVLEALSQK